MMPQVARAGCLDNICALGGWARRGNLAECSYDLLLLAEAILIHIHLIQTYVKSPPALTSNMQV